MNKLMIILFLTIGQYSLAQPLTVDSNIGEVTSFLGNLQRLQETGAIRKAEPGVNDFVAVGYKVIAIDTQDNSGGPRGCNARVILALNDKAAAEVKSGKYIVSEATYIDYFIPENKATGHKTPGTTSTEVTTLEKHCRVALGIDY